MKTRNTLAAAIWATSLSCIGSAQADDWEFRIAPYLWATSLTGTVAAVPSLPPVDVEMSFSDILDNLDFAGMIVGQARNGRWGFSGDLQYVKLSAGNPSPGALFGQAQAKIKNTIVSLTADYLLSQGPGYEMWVSAGMRHWRVSTDITLTPGAAPGGTGSGANDWVDPLIGIRGRRDVGERTYLTGWAYLGGFGTGSEEMSDLFAGFGYQFTPTTSGILGYRYMNVDRRDGNFLYDTEQQGLLAGVGFRF